MNAVEAGQLLAVLSAVDRREVDTTTAQGWAWALSDVPLARALEAAQRAIRAGVGYVDVLAIQRELRAMQPALERDVRSAKARGLVPESWPREQPLTEELEARLRAVQAGEWAATNDRAEHVAPLAGKPAELGAIGRAL